MKKTDFEKDLINTLRSFKTNEDVNPSVLFKENTKIRLMNLVSEQEKAAENKSGFVFVKNPKFAFRLAGIFLIVLIFISTGTILAAQSANPKNTLYPIKLASEEIALKLSPTPSLKANIAVGIAKRRGDEITIQQNTDSKSEIKYGIEKYKESINQAKQIVPSDNTHLTSELKNEEQNLDQLTHRYEEDSNQDVKGASDTNINSSEQNKEQIRSEIKLPVREQTTTQETNREEIRVQSSPSDNFNKTIQDIRDNVEKSVREITDTPSPSSSPEEQH